MKWPTPLLHKVACPEKLKCYPDLSGNMQHVSEQSERLYGNSIADVVCNVPETHEAVASNHGRRIWLLHSAVLSH